MYKEIFECSDIAMLLVNEDGIIKLVNKCSEFLFGYKRDEMIGKNVEMLVPEKVREKHPELVKGWFISPTPIKMGVGRNVTCVTKENKSIAVEVGLNPIQIDKETQVMCSVINITEKSGVLL